MRYKATYQPSFLLGELNSVPTSTLFSYEFQIPKLTNGTSSMMSIDRNWIKTTTSLLRGIEVYNLTKDCSFSHSQYCHLSLRTVSQKPQKRGPRTLAMTMSWNWTRQAVTTKMPKFQKDLCSITISQASLPKKKWKF